MELSPGWNEVLQTIEVTYDGTGAPSSFANTMANGPVPSGAEWLLITNFLRGQVEAEKDYNDEFGDFGGAAYLAYHSGQGTISEVFIRANVDDPGPLSIEGFDLAGREVLIYFGLSDSDNTDDSLDPSIDDDYELNATDGTDMVDVFIMVYSEESQNQITAGTGPADNTTQIDGTPLGNYQQITGGTLTYIDSTYSFSLDTTDGAETINGNYTPNEPVSFDYADYPF